MSFDSLLALAGFCLATSGTPGPNNVMLMTSGVNFGFRRSLPHLLGVALGFTAMIGIGAVGFAGIFTPDAAIIDVIAVVGALYLFYLALKIMLTPVERGMEADVVEVRGTPLSFLGAAAFQWVNPKAWVIMAGLISIYVPKTGMTTLLAVNLAANLISCVVWVAFGTAVAQLLSTRLRLRAFNLVMGVLLILSLLPAMHSFAKVWAMLPTG